MGFFLIKNQTSVSVEFDSWVLNITLLVNCRPVQSVVVVIAAAGAVVNCCGCCSCSCCSVIVFTGGFVAATVAVPAAVANALDVDDFMATLLAAVCCCCWDCGLVGVGVAGIWCQFILFCEVILRVFKSGGFLMEFENAMPLRKGTLNGLYTETWLII